MTPSKTVLRQTAITNGRLVLPHALVTDRALLLRDGKILGFVAPNAMSIFSEFIGLLPDSIMLSDAVVGDSC